MITQPDFSLGLIGAFLPWNSRPLDASFSNTTLKLTLKKIRPGFFCRVERFVVCFHCRSLFPKVAVMFMQPSCMGEGFSPPTEQMLFPIYQESPILTSPKADSPFYLGVLPPFGPIPNFI